MTAQQVIEKADRYKQGNTATEEQKLEWLSELEQMVYEEIILEHLHPLPINGQTSRWWSVVDGKWTFAPCPVYTQANSDDELICRDEFYVYWLMAKIDLHSQDLNRYNNDYALFENAYRLYKNKYHRKHRSIRNPEIKVGTFR